MVSFELNPCSEVEQKLILEVETDPRLRVILCTRVGVVFPPCVNTNILWERLFFHVMLSFIQMLHVQPCGELFRTHIVRPCKW